MHTVRKLKIGRSEYLDMLAEECGRHYTKALVYHWRVYRKKGLFLSNNGMQRIIHETNNLHAHTVDACVEDYYSAWRGYNRGRKIKPGMRPPHKLKRFHPIRYKSSQIKVVDGKLRLSNGAMRFMYFDWKWDLPKHVTIRWNGSEYEIIAVYKTDIPDKEIGSVAAIDLGEIHMAAVYDGESCITINGRQLRSVKRYREKELAKYRKSTSNKQKGSKNRNKAVKKHRKRANRWNNQIHDIMHKSTSRLVNTLHERGVRTIVIGDVRSIRNGFNCGKNVNQKIHYWNHGEFRRMVTYKAERLGMNVELIDESYTSQTCPACGHRYKPKGRMYKCSACAFNYHRDGVGAINIRSKYLGGIPVVGVMASPIGVRYSPHMQCRHKGNSSVSTLRRERQIQGSVIKQEIDNERNV